MKEATNLLRLVELMGDDHVKRLIDTFGGTTIKVPTGEREQFLGPTRLREFFDYPACDILFREFGGTALYIPRDFKTIIAARNAAIMADVENGMSASQIARKYKISDRWVFKIKEAARNIQQSSLPF